MPSLLCPIHSCMLRWCINPEVHMNQSYSFHSLICWAHTLFVLQSKTIILRGHATTTNGLFSFSCCLKGYKEKGGFCSSTFKRFTFPSKVTSYIPLFFIDPTSRVFALYQKQNVIRCPRFHCCSTSSSKNGALFSEYL